MRSVFRIINPRQGNLLLGVCGILTGVIIIFWLLPQFFFHTFFLYFKGIETSETKQLELSRFNKIERFVQIIDLPSELSKDPIWKSEFSISQSHCRETISFGRELSNQLVGLGSVDEDRLIIWGSETQQTKYYDQLTNLYSQYLYCLTSGDFSSAEGSDKLLLNVDKLSQLRQQINANSLHLNAFSYLKNPALNQLTLIKRFHDSKSLKLQYSMSQSQQWNQWLVREKIILSNFLDKFDKEWIPQELSQLIISRNSHWLGPWDEISFKGFLHSLHVRRELYSEIMDKAQFFLMRNNYNPNIFKAFESELLKELQLSFKTNLDNGIWNRFLDFLIASRTFSRRIRHQCYKDLSLDLKQDIIQGIHAQLRLIGRLEYIIENLPSGD